MQVARARRDLALVALVVAAAIAALFLAGDARWALVLVPALLWYAWRQASSHADEIRRHAATTAQLREALDQAEAAEDRAARLNQQLRDALDVMPEGFALFDGDNRFVLWNKRYLEFYAESADLIAVGVKFEDALRRGAERGQYLAAQGRIDAWVAERLAAHGAMHGTHEQLLADGRWLRIDERRTADGGSVGVRVDITELKNSERSVRMLFEKNPVPLYVVDLETLRFLEVNTAALRQYGYDRATFLALSLEDIRPLDEREAVRRSARSMPPGFSKRGVWRHQRADGTELFVEITAHTAEFEGRPAAIVTAVDITELKNSERSVRMLFEKNPVPLYVYDRETFGFVEVNTAALQQYGYDRETFLAMSLDDIRPPEERAELRRAARALPAGFFKLGVWRHCRADGTELFAEITAHTTEFKGRPATIIAAIDVTELKRNEAALRDSEARLRKSQAHLAAAQLIAAIGSWELDAETRRFTWSEEMYRLHGFAPSDETIELERALAFIDAADRDMARRMIEQALAGSPTRSLDYRIVRADGEVRMVHCQGRLAVERGGSRKLLGTMQDVTEARAAEAKRHALEAQLRHAQRLEALGTLAGGIAHDLNNTLVPIISLTKLTMNKLERDSRAWQNLQLVAEAGARGRALVQQILAFSRREQGEKSVIDLAENTMESLRLLRVGLPSTIRIEQRLEPGIRVLADPGQLHQVVMNLVTNAAQAIGDGIGTIALRLASEPDRRVVRLEVSDTGPGMDGATAQRVFEPFFTTRPVGEGTGLGLAVVHGIVTNHDGQIAVGSAPGAGATFTVTLPIHGGAAAAPRAAAG
jgi:PAS domain S-box-containing protein